MVLWFLRFLLKEHRSEWAGIYERSEQYITKELGGDLEVEEIAIAGGRKAVRERFEIKDDLIVHSKTIVIARRTVSVRLVRLLLSYQKESGCFELDNHLAETLDFSSVRPKKQRKVWKLISHLIQKFQNLMDKQTEEELLETARNFIRKRFDVDDEVLKVDETFKSTLALNIPLNIKKEIEDENGAIVTQVIIGLLKIKVKNARNLPKSSLLFTSSKPDPYVRILDASGQEIVRTRTISERLSQNGKKFIMFQFMAREKTLPLRLWIRIYLEPIRELFSLVIGRKPSGGELDLEVQFVSTQYNWKETWKNISADSEEWLGSEIDNIELEDKLYEICENFIIKRFNIKDLDEEQKNILISVKKRVIITRKLVTIRVIRRIHVYQTQDRAIPLDKTAELLGFENTEDLKKELQTYFKSESVKKVERLWVLRLESDVLEYEVEDSKYITQTYNFSLNDLKEAYDNNGNE
ncbi:unnamed protein product [Rhizophagus irregularis]|nr:unnamed protein product [Rhizophagus irregularis]